MLLASRRHLASRAIAKGGPLALDGTWLKLIYAFYVGLPRDVIRVVEPKVERRQNVRRLNFSNIVDTFLLPSNGATPKRGMRHY